MSAARGRMVDGAEAELQAAAGVGGHGIPLELWDVPISRRDGEGERETRAITPAPGTVGVNLDAIRPAVFANSIAPRLGIEMPRVMSGFHLCQRHDHDFSIPNPGDDVAIRLDVTDQAARSAPLSYVPAKATRHRSSSNPVSANALTPHRH